MNQNHNPTECVDLWNLAQDLDAKSKEIKAFERTVIFLGESNSGKSSIISLLKGTLKDEPPKPTSAIEYSFARRNNENRKEIVYFYEMAGGRFIKDLISVPLTLNTITNATFVITLDLNNPSSVLDSLIFWVDNIKENLEKALSAIQVNNPTELNNYKQKKLNEFENFSEKQKMSHIFANVIVLANKYDVFETEEIESRKWMSRILRYYCHSNSLSLFYSSVVNPKLSAQIKTLLISYLFSDISPNVLQKDHMKPIFVSKGLDNIDSIGVTMAGNFNYIDLLKKISKEYFPSKQSFCYYVKNKEINFLDDNQKIYGPIDFSKFTEPLIDNTKSMKDKVMQTMLKKHKIDVENKKSTYENNKMEFDGEDFGEKEQIIENSNYKSDNFYENPLITKPNTSNLKSNNPPTNSSNPPLLVKKYRPGLTKPQQNN